MFYLIILVIILMSSLIIILANIPTIILMNSLMDDVVNVLIIILELFEFLNVYSQNLDALHDHLGTLYPGMKAPSFRCTERPEDGALILHYYSDRPGLDYIVIGIVKVFEF